MRYILIGIYIAILLLTFFFISHSVTEHFELVVTTQDKTGQCFECLAFYSTGLKLKDSNPEAILLYIDAQNDFITAFFDSLDDFLTQRSVRCKEISTIDEYIDCINGYVSQLECLDTANKDNCRIRDTLLASIISKATMCGSKITIENGKITTPIICRNIADFEQNFIVEYNKLKRDFDTCKANFDKPTSECVSKFSSMINTTSGVDSLCFTDERLVTRGDLNKRLYDMSTYIGTQDYRG